LLTRLPRKPRLLVAFECSGVVRRAFAAAGWDAWSCDLQPAQDGGAQHLQCDARSLLGGDWDMLIAHPPCTFITYAGARWWGRAGWKDKQEQALGLFWTILNAPIPAICVENPRGLPAKVIRKPDDVVEPYEFGDPVKKRTYLWLKNLPPLMRTNRLTWWEEDWTVNQTHDRQNTRSKTFAGIANAMAAQWIFVPEGA